MALDFSILATVWPALLKGTIVTVQLTVAVLLLATPIGAVVAVARASSAVGVAKVVAVLSWVARGVPPLLLLFFFFFALPQIGVRLPPLVSAIVAMTAYMSFYFAEVIRGGIASVPEGQWRAARALGLSPARTYVRVVLPQALPAALPSYVSHATEVLKGTALAAAVAVPELTNAARQVFVVTFRPFEVLIAAAAIYAVLDGLLVALQVFGERYVVARYKGTR